MKVRRVKQRIEIPIKLLNTHTTLTTGNNFVRVDVNGQIVDNLNHIRSQGFYLILEEREDIEVESD